jgi:hypothetical protein
MNGAFWKYYVDVTRYNVAVSMAVGLVSADALKAIFCFVTGGMLLSIICYQQLQNNQYYFYYNLGLTKKRLILTTWLVNLIIAAVSALLLPVFRFR